MNDGNVGVKDVTAVPVVPYKVGNWTYIGKPIFPIKVAENQIRVGENWTYVCSLRAGVKYHVYFFGDWVDDTPLVDKTDYDIYVYNPFGKLESMHTESAGLPEHLGTTVYDPFFIPEYTGNYSFLIKNDGKESKGAKGGTFMVIEHLECNQWYEVHMQGKNALNEPTVDTYWAYEFTTTSGRVEVPVIVPDPPESYLDMYEVQLYLMANPLSGIGEMLNGMPLPWEPGLYGSATTAGSATYGGFRLTGEGFIHANASDSCENYGQDMLIEYSSGISASNTNMLLYHLALIAEEGEGTVRFMFKTDFEAPTLELQSVVNRVCSDEEVTITAVASDDGVGLESVTLYYTTDNWVTWNTVEMASAADNKFVAFIPSQLGGKTVKYKVVATDVAGNCAVKEASYVVKNRSSLYIALSNTVLTGGDGVKVNGWVSKGLANVTLDFVIQNIHVVKNVFADADGSFVYEFTPNAAGTWSVSASWPGTQEWWDAYSELLSFVVRKVPTSITCNINRVSAILGETIDISGYVAPAERNLMVTIRLTQPDGTVITRTAYTSSDGSYEVSGFQLNVKGQWQIMASLEGDAFHQSSSSSSVSLTVSDHWYNEYRLYIIAAGGVAGIAIVGVFFFTRSKEEAEEE
ncbi:hypothetical protein KEJ18_02245 [Candidatus Bathyarchaeota archaeon]|nr:hypothetical protein [Candidatus Bathyarchaeota archaeon]